MFLTTTSIYLTSGKVEPHFPTMVSWEARQLKTGTLIDASSHP
jgi:hypothetical protein